MYGVRGFSEVVVFRGWAVRLDAERMNTYVLPATLNRDLGARRWVWNYMAGVKKEFTFIPGLWPTFSSCITSMIQATGWPMQTGSM